MEGKAGDGEESPLQDERRGTPYILDVPDIQGIPGNRSNRSTRSIPPAMPGKGITGSRNLKNACGDEDTPDGDLPENPIGGVIAEYEPGDEKNQQQQ